MNKTELFGVNDLVEGMILGEDIYGKYDLLVLSRGKVLTQQNISVIKSQGLDYIYVSVSSEEDLIIEQAYDVLLDEIKEIYEGSSTITKELKERMGNNLHQLLGSLLDNSYMLMELKRLKVKDIYTAKHSLNVALLSGLMGVWLELSDEDVEELMLAGALHDIGKTFVSVDILNKPGMLSELQFKEIQNHTSYGYKKLNVIPDIPESVKRVALEHHERVDGSGYPAMKTSENMHFFSKIVSIADVFDASTTNKIYGERIHPLNAIQELRILKNEGKIDSTLFTYFINNIYKTFVGCNIELSDGSKGQVAFFHKLNPERPIMRVNGRLLNLAHRPDLKIVDIY